jgi:hypothetical protein
LLGNGRQDIAGRFRELNYKRWAVLLGFENDDLMKVDLVLWWTEMGDHAKFGRAIGPWLCACCLLRKPLVPLRMDGLRSVL